MTDTFIHDDPDVASTEAAMIADGVNPTDGMQQEYWGTDETYKVIFPDGVTYVECQYLTEGDRVKYQTAVQKDVRLAKASGDAYLKMASGEERRGLLGAAIVGWNLIRNGQPVPFTKGEQRGGRTTGTGELEKWLQKAPPVVIDLIEKEIRLHEPWITSDITVEQIDQQIEDLLRLKEMKMGVDEGNDS